MTTTENDRQAGGHDHPVLGHRDTPVPVGRPQRKGARRTCATRDGSALGVLTRCTSARPDRASAGGSRVAAHESAAPPISGRRVAMPYGGRPNHRPAGHALPAVTWRAAGESSMVVGELNSPPAHTASHGADRTGLHGPSLVSGQARRQAGPARRGVVETPCRTGRRTQSSCSSGSAELMALQPNWCTPGRPGNPKGFRPVRSRWRRARDRAAPRRPWPACAVSDDGAGLHMPGPSSGPPDDLEEPSDVIGRHGAADTLTEQRSTLLVQLGGLLRRRRVDIADR
ncbi:hypothetical protein SATRM34S_00839 [Streptomyces atroolivaceus]